MKCSKRMKNTSAINSATLTLTLIGLRLGLSSGIWLSLGEGLRLGLRLGQGLRLGLR